MSDAITNLSRKEQVIRKAAELFKDKGYAAASMRDLAQLLGIEAASLYSHIKSKEEILRSLCFAVREISAAAHRMNKIIGDIDLFRKRQRRLQQVEFDRLEPTRHLFEFR